MQQLEGRENCVQRIEVDRRMRKPQPEFGKIKLLQHLNKLLKGKSKPRRVSGPTDDQRS